MLFKRVKAKDEPMIIRIYVIEVQLEIQTFVLSSP